MEVDDVKLPRTGAPRRRPWEETDYLRIFKEPLLTFEYTILNYGVEEHMTLRQKRGVGRTWVCL